jgi:hypothetical protein
MTPDRPAGHEIPVGWTIVRLETHNQEKIDIGYLYLCPGCTIEVVSRQTTLTG